MRAQAKVRNRYVVIRLTHKQLLAVDHALGDSTYHPDAMDSLFEGNGRGRRACMDGAEIIGHVVRTVLRGERGSLSRAGMLYDYEVTDAEKAVKSGR